MCIRLCICVHVSNVHGTCRTVCLISPNFVYVVLLIGLLFRWFSFRPTLKCRQFNSGFMRANFNENAQITCNLEINILVIAVIF